MKIETLDFPDDVLDILKKDGITELNDPQISAIEAGLFDRKNLVVASPTASGKTLIAELAVIKNFLSNKKSVYIVPLKALASEKYEEFKRKYEKIGLKVAISIGDLDNTSEWLGRYDLIIVSNEKMDSLLRHNAEWIENISLVICDEIHLLNDPSRGPTLEIVLTRLRELTHSQLLALSATISNAKEIAAWLNAKLVKSTYRPIPLFKGISYPHNENLVIEFQEYSYKFLGDGDHEYIITRDALTKHKQSIIFLSTRRNCEAVAEKIARKLKIEKNEKNMLEKLGKEIKNALPNPTKQCKRLADIVSNGAAFHHAGLVAKQRKIIEDNFRAGVIKIITATPTLAFGLNMPAWRVVIRDVKRFSQYGYNYISALEIQQMCGRAGRPRYDTEGEAIIVAKSEKEASELFNRYILGDIEPVYSKLAVEPVLRMHTLALIASETVKTRYELIQFFEKTFFAHQYGDMTEIEQKIKKILQELESYKFITAEKDEFISQDFIPAFDLKDTKIKATKIGKRISQLYMDPVSGNHIIKNLRPQSDIEYMLMLNQCREAWPLITVRKHEDIEGELIRYKIESPDVWDFEFGEFLMAFKTSLIFDHWMNEIGEDILFEQYNITPGELHTRLRNMDWMLYASSELALLTGKKDIANYLNKLRLRVRYGVKEELLNLIRLKNVGRSRARKLWRNNIKNISDIRKSSDLEKILGKNIAKQLKVQIREDLDKKIRVNKHRQQT